MDRAETQRWIDRIKPCETELVGEEIVFLSHQRWEEHFTPLHGMTIRLAQKNRVLYMEPPDSFGWIPHLFYESDHRHKYARRALKYTFQRLEMYGSDLGVYHSPPFFIPCQSRSDLIVKSMNLGYAAMIREGMRKMGFSNPIVWTVQFNTLGAVESLDPKAIVYECPEEAAEFVASENLKQYVWRMETDLCRRADMVFVPNDHMVEAKKDLCREIHMIPWPADVAHYGQAMDPDLPVPEQIASIPHPIIGIYANIDVRRFNTEFLCALARRRPEWSLVLVGRVLPDFDAEPFEKMPNIHLIPKQPLEDLPGFVKAFDVCMIPYELNAFTRSITPIKMAEYLASGRPVVTTALPAAKMYEDALYVANDLDDFEAKIQTALNESGDERRAQRLAAARRFDWNHHMSSKTSVIAEKIRGAAVPAPPSEPLAYASHVR